VVALADLAEAAAAAAALQAVGRVFAEKC